MKILKKDLKHGKVSLAVETLDDLWHLSQIIEPEDFVTSKTTRKVKLGDKEEASKKTITLTVQIESVELDDLSLRCSGITSEENEDIPKGSHHSIALEEGSFAVIVKKAWLTHHLKRLEEASEKQGTTLLLILDREEAMFAAIKSKGYEVLSQVKGKVAKKGMDTVTSDFYAELAKMLDDYYERLKPSSVIVASPAFWKDDFAKRTDKKLILASCSSVSTNAVEEVLKRPELKESFKAQRSAAESRIVEELMSEIAKDGLSAYGAKEVKTACETGNVKTFLITTKFISKNRASSEGLMKSADSVKGDIVIVNSDNEAGKKLDSLGGIGVIGRYKSY